jgi:hypothetical protein
MKKSYVDLLKKLESEFSLTPWGLIAKGIEEANSGYGGQVEVKWSGEKSYEVTASLEMTAWVYGVNDEHRGEAEIVWNTSSDHYVKIELYFTVAVYKFWAVKSITIGNDASEYFYSTIVDIANELGVELITINTSGYSARA